MKVRRRYSVGCTECTASDMEQLGTINTAQIITLRPFQTKAVSIHTTLTIEQLTISEIVPIQYAEKEENYLITSNIRLSQWFKRFTPRRKIIVLTSVILDSFSFVSFLFISLFQGFGLGSVLDFVTERVVVRKPVVCHITSLILTVEIVDLTMFNLLVFTELVYNLL